MSVQKAINNFGGSSESVNSGSTLSVGSGSVTGSPLRKSWGPYSKYAVAKLSQEELVMKLMEEEAATAALQMKLKEIVNSRLEMEEIRNKIVQMLSDVRDTLSVFEHKAATNNEEPESKGRSSTVCVIPDEDKELTEDDKKRLEEEKSRQKIQERIQKERKKAEERQKKFRDKESVLLTKSLSENQTEDKGGEDKKENPTIEVKSAFRRVEGITIDQLRQDAEKALKDDSNSTSSPASQHKQLDKSWRLSLNFKKKDKDKSKDKDVSKGLAKVLKAKAELIAQEKEKLKAQQGGQ